MTAQGGDILAWLESAITLREQVARLAQKGAEGRWHSGGDSDDRNADEFEFKATHVADDQGRIVVYNEVHPSKAQSVYIALSDPASVLRRCAADRKLIAAHPITRDVITVQPDGTHGFGCAVCHAEDLLTAGDGWCDTLLALAEGYGWTGGER